MKKLILLTLTLTTMTLSFSQGGQKMRDRIKAQKVAFITERLNLTPAEATKFWPIYNAFEGRVEEVRNGDMRTIKTKIRQNPDMADAEADKLLEELISAEDKMYRAKVKLINDLKGVIPSKKIIKLKRAEDEFNQKLLERLKEMRNKRGPRRD